MIYYKFSDYLKNKYNTKVYKIPINIPVSCPNRDGQLAFGGCIFCGDEGAGFENLKNSIPIYEQININIEYIKKNYNANKYIAYFQNFSNTYLPFEVFKSNIYECLHNDFVAIYISTRPDCISCKYLEFLRDIKRDYNIDILIELGLQTVNYKTLKILNRGHTLAEFIDAVNNIKNFQLQSCAHYILDLPYDDIDDVIEGAKVLSALRIEQVKCHSLYILRNTKLGDMYNSDLIKPLSIEQYIDRIITFLEYLNPSIIIQRLIGRAPKSETLFCNWDTSWWKVVDMIEQKMKEEGSYQGKNFNYLNGEQCIKKF